METRGCGFLADRRPLILFERHYFSRLTKRKFDAQAPDISNKQWGGYGGGGRGYDRLGRAVKLDRAAALRSASWGLGQVMGENFKAAGFPDVEPMVAAFVESENAPVEGMARSIASIGADTHLRAHNWPAFTAAYNGPAYAQNSYDERLRAAHQKYVTGALPDLNVRAIAGLSRLSRLQPGPGGRRGGAIHALRAPDVPGARGATRARGLRCRCREGGARASGGRSLSARGRAREREDACA